MSQKQYHQVLVVTLAAAAIAANTFVDAEGNVAAANERAYGIARSDAAVGEHFPVGVLGQYPVIASGAIAVGAPVRVGANGKAAAANVANVAGLAAVVGQAVEAAAADGDEIAVLLR